MFKPYGRFVLLYILIAAIISLSDVVIDRLFGDSPALNLPHLIFMIVVVITCFVLLNRALNTHEQAEAALRRAQDELGLRVHQRTAQLELANEALQAEIVERQQAQQEREQSLLQAEYARQRAEQMTAELQVANSTLWTIIETLPAGLVITDSGGGIVLANAQAQLLLGEALGSVAHRAPGDPMICQLDGAALLTEALPLTRALRQGLTTTGIEALLRRPDGDETFVLMAASPVRDETGRIISAVQIVQDISALKRMQYALRASEERYRTQFDDFSEPTTVWDRNGVLLMQNLISARSLGGRREEFIGKSVYDLYGGAAPSFMARMRRVIDTGLTENQEDVVDLYTGRRYYWTCMQRNQNPDGQFTVQVISYDITDRKYAEEALRASEEKFATVFHYSPDAIGIARVTDGVFLDVNEACAKLLGSAWPQSEVTGKTWGELGLQAPRHHLQRLIARFQKFGFVADYELDLQTRAGAVSALLSLISISVSGEPCALVIAHDITERKRSEAALRAAQAEVARGLRERTALEERQRLARELHDSVSQALYGISLGAHTALTLFETNHVKVLEALNYVLSLAQAGLTEMRALIFELRPESLEAEGLVVALTKQAAALRARYGLEVVLSLCDEPAAALATKEALYRIGQEAMHNAVKHARPNRLEVRLAQSGEGLELEVRDDGVGFDPGGSFPGHLGLRSMRERALNAGGTWAITSTVDRGTRVYASIPWKASERPAAPETAPLPLAND